MPAYLIIEGEVTDQTKWAEYSKAVVPLIERFGGKHLNAPRSSETLEGVHKDWIVALFEFGSMGELKAFWNSPDYVPVKAVRQNAATLEIKAVAGV